MKKAIVTGANGFLGSALCRHLSEQGVEVLAVVRDETSKIERLQGIDNLSIVFCDMSSYDSFTDIVPPNDYDIVYHMAWEGSAGELRGDSDTQLRNIEYSCKLIEACAAMGCERFVYASSIMGYEIQAAISSGKHIGINSLYSAAKVSADYMMRAIADDKGIVYLKAVISNVYGPGERSPRLVNTTIRRLLAGEHCSFSSGDQMYDFIYVSDAVREFYEIGKKGKSGRTYYIGSRQPRPLKDFLNKIRDIVSPDEELGLGELPFDGVSLSYREFDVDAVYNDTGFEPKVSFEEGIRGTMLWIQEESSDGI